MPKQTYKLEEIITKLRETEVRLSQGTTVGEVIRSLGISEVTYYRWHKNTAECRWTRRSDSRNWRKRMLACLGPSLI